MLGIKDTGHVDVIRYDHVKYGNESKLETNWYANLDIINLNKQIYEQRLLFCEMKNSIVAYPGLSKTS
jgi:hypothetical protein